MAILQNAPNEILSHILSYLSPNDLTATSLVSRRFHAISRPRLYRNLLLHVFPENNLQLLLRTLMHAADRDILARHVRSLHLVSHKPVSPLALVMSVVTASSMASVSCIGLDDQHRISWAGVQRVRLLHLLPHLDKLEINVDHGWSCNCYSEFNNALQQPMALPLALQTIREFSSLGPEWSTGMTPTILTGLMVLPSIRKLSVAIDDDTEDNPQPFSATGLAGTSNITDLHLETSSPIHASLAALLTVPKALTTFSYDAYSFYYFLNLPKFGHALQPLRASVKHLQLNFRDGTQLFADTENDDAFGTIGTLREWSKLQTLSCPLMTLLGRTVVPDESLVDLLPLSLRTLQVLGGNYRSDAETIELVARMLDQRAMAALRTVAVVSKKELRGMTWWGNGSINERMTVEERERSKLAREREAVVSAERMRVSCEEAQVVWVKRLKWKWGLVV